MSKYKVEVGSFVTRQIIRRITVNAKTEDEAKEKAIQKYWDMEANIPNSVDAGSPQVDDIEELN